MKLGKKIGRQRTGEAGLTLVELIVAFTILFILTSMAVPMARRQVQRQREKELRNSLREMRTAIDRYKDMCDQGKLQAKAEQYCYPAKLDDLVEGVQMQGVISSGKNTGKARFLRRVPKDPLTGDTDWGKRSMQDDPKSSTWGGQNVFDVFSKSMDNASDGKPYAEW